MRRMPSTSAPPDVTRQLTDRLRRAPSRISVAGSLPVLFFGDALSARLLTVGLNPSDQEYLDRQGAELNGARRRFHTLASLGAQSREELTDDQCRVAMEAMRGYFDTGRPVYRWFRPLARVVEAMGASFLARTAAHLDLVQEPTRPVWSVLPEPERAALLVTDLPFLRWQLTNLPARAIACNGQTVLRSVIELTGAKVVKTGALQRILWTTARADGGHGGCLGIVGWNYPLTRPTGLGVDGERMLGEILGAEIDDTCGSGWRE